jgi:protein-disulfide isomerase
MTDDLSRPDGAASPVPPDAAPTIAAGSGQAAGDQGGDPGLAPLAPAPADAAVLPSESDATADAVAGRASRRTLAYVGTAIAGAVVIGALLVAGWSTASAASAPTAAPVLGAASAPVLVEVWADYQCPYCGALAHVLEPSLLRDYVAAGKIRMVFRDFSFLGQESTEAAAAARCAGQQGAYWRFHDMLFASQQGENQGAFAPERIMSLAAYAGLDPDAFAACMSDPAVRAAVADETLLGRGFGVESTPTLRIVGPAATKVVKGLSTLAVVDAAITEALTGVAPSPSPGADGSPSAPPASEPSASPADSMAPPPSAAPSGASAAP